MYYRYCNICAIGMHIFIGDLLPLMNGINHDLSIAFQICKVVLQHWSNIQYLALKHWSYCIELEATYASFLLKLSANIHSTV